MPRSYMPPSQSASDAAPVFEGVPPAIMTDRPLAVRVRGLPPGARATIRLGGRARLGGNRESAAEFIADEQGVVDLSTMAPVAGSYSGIDPMGLFWTRRRVEALTHPRPQDDENRITAAFYAEVDGEVVATAEHERLLVSPDCERVPLPKPWVGYMYRPKDRVPRKAVLAVGGSSGALFWSDNFASILASHGYVTVAVAHFNMGDLPKECYDIPLEYFESLIDWIAAQPECLPGGIAIAGTSRGAELALLLASRFPAIRAAVAFAPTHLVWPGPDRINPRPSWLYGGKPVPHMPAKLTPEQIDIARKTEPWIVRMFFDFCMEVPQEVKDAAAIPVERINGPLFLVAGEDDDIWRAVDSANAIRRRREAHNSPYSCEIHTYPGAGHRIIWPYEAVTDNSYLHGAAKRYYSYGGTPEGDAAAALDSWPRMLAFLEEKFDL